MFSFTSFFIAVAIFVHEPVLLIDDERAASVIVVPENASPTVRRAANEVAGYLHRITGAVMLVVPEDQATSGRRIDVGLTRKAQEFLPDDLMDVDERVVVRTVPDGVVICGGSDRGTLYAAYRFLESLGCRWLTPESENEIVPLQSTIILNDLNIDTRPAFTWRMFNAARPELEPWGLKMGFNGLYQPKQTDSNGDCLFWPEQVRGVHAFAAIIPSDRYFDSHPEWFPLIGGKRVASSPTVIGQLCVTAPGLAEQFAANVIGIFDTDPCAQLISISPNDGNGWCECPNCTSLDTQLCGGRTTKQGLADEEPFVSDRLFWFTNQVARRIEGKYPDRKLLVASYINYTEPPDTIRPAGNILPFICHYAPADYSRPVADSSSAPNREFDDLLRRWLAISPDVVIYSYVSKSMWWRLPRPVLEPFAADVKYYHHLGIHRYYCQSTLTDWAADGPLYYVLARLLWDPNADPSQIADEWIEGMFGPAATEMKDYYRAVGQSIRASGKPYSDNPPGQVPGLFDRQELDRAMAALARAEQVSSSALVHARIEKVASAFRSGYWMIRVLEEDKLGDPPLISWLSHLAFLAAVTCCGLVYLNQRQGQLSNRIGTPTFWISVTLLLLGLWINRSADLQTRMIDIGRRLTETQSWYQIRRIRIMVFLIVASVGGCAALGSVWWLARRQWKQNLLPLLGIALLCGFFLVRATSFDHAARPSSYHEFDAAFRLHFSGLSCRWVVELSCLSIVVAGAALALKGRRQEASSSGLG